MSLQSCEKTFTAKIEEVPAIVAYVADMAESVGMHPKRVMHLQLAVEEAVVNVCNYAYQVPPGEVQISISHESNRFVVKVQDEGVPFDPMTLEAPDLKAGIEERQVGGLGVYLMRRVMDEVHYFREGKKNILTLIVNLES